jgi:hypothetical protein
MLPVIKTREAEFHSAGAALAYLEGRAVQRFTVPLHDLRVDTSGVIHHTGPAPIEQLRGVPLTDTALNHLDALAGIPASYASHIEPDLHEHSLNELLERQLAAVTVVAECDRKEPESRHVVAVLPGSRPGIDDSMILQRIEAYGVGASISLRTGRMEVQFGSPAALEVLPGDELQGTGLLRNERWQFLKVSTTPTLEVGVYLLRLVCSNGAYARRVLAESRLMAWATRKEVDLFLDRQLTRILSFEAAVLKSAAAAMNESIPDEPERVRIRSLLARFLGAKRASALLDPTVSWWDHFNAVTAAANQVRSIPRRRRLQWEGGQILERFLEAA